MMLSENAMQKTTPLSWIKGGGFILNENVQELNMVKNYYLYNPYDRSYIVHVGCDVCKTANPTKATVFPTLTLATAYQEAYELDDYKIMEEII